MEKKTYTIEINATSEKVWQTLWNEMTYEQWTSVFHVGSYVVADWKEGGSVHFLNPSGSGMYSTISKLEPNHKMFFTHIGALENFKETPVDEVSKQWTGAQENYTLIQNKDKTTLTVAIDIVSEHINYFDEKVPSALEVLKDLAERDTISISTLIHTISPEKVWKYWNEPKHIIQWCQASDDWHVPKADNNLEIQGKFCTTMAAKNGSFSFDFEGIYDEIIPLSKIVYTLSDQRKVFVLFIPWKGGVKIVETFEAETANSLEMQKNGWQAILNSFKLYCEQH